MKFAIINGINAVFSLFWLIIIIRCALTFIPSIDYRKQPYKTIQQTADLYLDLFRKFIPPMGMIDISPIIALIALGIIQNIIVVLISSINF